MAAAGGGRKAQSLLLFLLPRLTLGVRDEGDPKPAQVEVLNSEARVLRDVPEHGEDGEPPQEGGQAVDDGDDEAVPGVASVLPLLVRPKSHDGPHGHPHGVEDLVGRPDPRRDVLQLFDVHVEVLLNPLWPAGQGGAPGDECGDAQVGQGDGDVHDLTPGAHALDQHDARQQPRRGVRPEDWPHNPTMIGCFFVGGGGGEREGHGLSRRFSKFCQPFFFTCSRPRGQRWRRRPPDKRKFWCRPPTAAGRRRSGTGRWRPTR